MPEIITKLINGRKVKEEIVFEKEAGTMPFTAYYRAVDYLINEQYLFGFSDGKNPIGIQSKQYSGLPPRKWHNLTKDQKDSLAGLIMSSNFHSEDVKIVFFED